jgi:hypothetical protein
MKKKDIIPHVTSALHVPVISSVATEGFEFGVEKRKK